MSYFKKLNWNGMLFSICAIAIGVLMIFFPQEIMTALSIFIAAVPILFGIRVLWDYRENKETYKLVLGSVLVLAGIFILFNMDAILSFVTYAIAAIIVISGVLKVKDAIELKKMREHWIPLLVFAIICIILGLMVLGMPMNHNDDGTKTAGDFMIQCAGVILAVTGLIDLITTMTVSGKIKEWKIYINSEDYEE